MLLFIPNLILKHTCCLSSQLLAASAGACVARIAFTNVRRRADAVRAILRADGLAMHCRRLQIALVSRTAVRDSLQLQCGFAGFTAAI